VFYVATRAEAIYVLLAFEKKTRKKGESEHLLVRASAPMH